MEWFKKCLLEKYADFSGRARRKEYWMFVLFSMIAMVVLMIVGGVLDAIFGSNGIVSMILLVVYALAIFMPSLAVAIRRLHDLDKSGWWYLIAFIPFGSIVLLVFFCLEGTPGAN
ncbi:DUF805 domain-containing protein [Limnobaculum zhutongyuii]|uniref:DUF805 domain-containing protein n=1 Tax=Limnobaculum zhutongyuii TaxID=2498113 RepID=A0A411WFT5_9GAMM|nr:DUF805 domain-containing protein [Limnobaculum zhutongyuii]QBH95095.1 DUF805 domain-containing protein [Limnobaculum zhutongyuii]TQS86583.1 DUF805 domain-containing protein [Limnobaculum zhutongyuii]